MGCLLCEWIWIFSETDLCGFSYDLVNWCPLKYLATNDCFHLIFNIDSDGINLYLVIINQINTGHHVSVRRYSTEAHDPSTTQHGIQRNLGYIELCWRENWSKVWYLPNIKKKNERGKRRKYWDRTFLPETLQTVIL